VALKNLWAPSDFEDLDNGKSTRGKVPPIQSTAATAAAVENPSGTFFMAGSTDVGLSGEKPSARLRVLAAMCGGAIWVKAKRKRQIYNMYRDMRVVSKIRWAAVTYSQCRVVVGDFRVYEGSSRVSLMAGCIVQAACRVGNR
jgi:hypothetical protein